MIPLLRYFSSLKPQNRGFEIFTRALLLLVLLQAISCSREISTPKDIKEMEENFKNPPNNVKPWVYWYWINNHISKKGITEDLESMAKVGIGAAFIGNIYLGDIPQDGKVPMLSAKWEELTQFAIREGGRLGVDIGLFNGPGWSQSGGPWNDLSNTMRYITYEEYKVNGGRNIAMKLDRPSEDFEDVSQMAFPTLKGKKYTNGSFKVTSSKELTNLNNLLDDDLGTIVPISGLKDVDLVFKSEKGRTSRSLKIFPSKATFTMDVKLLAEKNGRWVTIRTFKFDRSNDMDQLGFDDYPPVVVSFQEVNSKKFKLELRNINPTNNSKEAGLADISFSPQAQLEFYIEKQLGKMHQTPLPLDDAYKWPSQKEPNQKSQIVATNNMVDISDKISKDGTLNWNAPKGAWTIVRFGMTATGIKNAPAAPNATGLEVDKMDRKALNQHFESFIGKILSSMPKEDRKAFKYVVADSYETGSQNWTNDFGKIFLETYGYDSIDYLPVLTGRIVNSVDQSNRFLWDLRRLVADKVAYEYVGGLKELCNKNGLQMWLENYGHWGFPSEFLLYGGQSDLIGGEFWAEGNLGSIECRAASSAAHIYGKKQVSAESYTASGKPFLRYPGELKKRGDWSFTEGINHAVFHVYIHQPYDSVPGVNAWFGTEFNRQNTWFDSAKPWVDYQRRCQYMLQQGLYVADVAYFIGEDAPKMTGVRNPELPKGYSFDYINADVIKNRITVKNGRITLPDGLSYRILVLPDSDTMRPELLEKIKELVAQGAVIVGNPPKRSPSLKNYGKSDSIVESLAKEIWGESYNDAKKEVDYGQGKVFRSKDLAQVLKDLGSVPDFKTITKQPVLWIHRKMINGDIYFISNQSDKAISFDASFRIKGMQPRLWDANTGATRLLPEFSEQEDYTNVPLKLEVAESRFIVFSEDTGNNSKNEMHKNFSDYSTLKDIDGQWNVHFKSLKLDIDKTLVMGELEDWTKIKDADIKYFSGKAIYQTQFILDEVPSSKKIFLDIGKANVLANIKVNGQYVGGLWTAPWRIEVTDYLVKGENALEISVANLWVNQLIQDADRDTKDKKTWTLTETYGSDGELQPSGLIGPVRLINFDLGYKK